MKYGSNISYCFDNLWVRRISTLDSSLAQVYFVKTELAGIDECRATLLPWWDLDQILIWIVWMSHFFKFNRVSGLFYWKSQKWFDYRFTKSNLKTWKIRIFKFRQNVPKWEIVTKCNFHIITWLYHVLSRE